MGGRVFNLGSINLDYFYQVAHLPTAGETIAARDFRRGLGGKGANQSVAAALSGAEVVHLGAVGEDPPGLWAVERLESFGVDVSAIARLDVKTAHALIFVDERGENQIVVQPGANRRIEKHHLEPLDHATAGDWCLLQNETNMQPEAANRSKAKHARVAYSAAPFDVEALSAVRENVDLLLLNSVEAAALTSALETEMTDLGIENIVVTQGSKGVDWIHAGERRAFAAPKVSAIDTTGAGDTLAGFLVGQLAQRRDFASSLETALFAAALKVTRNGTAEAIPDLEMVTRFATAYEDTAK